MHNEGFWYSVGRGFWSFFEGLDWIYANMSPNKIFIVLGFICFFWWIKLQAGYNKKAAKDGSYK